jgi:hypothetical protein
MPTPLFLNRISNPALLFLGMGAIFFSVWNCCRTALQPPLNRFRR